MEGGRVAPAMPVQSASSSSETTALNVQSSPKTTALNVQSSPKTTALNVQNSPKTTALNVQSSPKTTALNVQNSPKTTALNVQNSPKTTALNVQSSPKTTALNVQNSPKTTALNVQNSPKTTALNVQSSPKTTALNVQNSPKTTALNVQNSPKTTALNVQSSPKTTALNVQNSPKTTVFNIQNSPKTTAPKTQTFPKPAPNTPSSPKTTSNAQSIPTTAPNTQNSPKTTPTAQAPATSTGAQNASSPGHRNDPAAKNATSAPGSATGSPRRRNRQGENKNNNEKYGQMVYVSGFPPYTQAPDLGRAFSKFGNVRIERLNARMSFAVLTYTTEEEAKEAVQASKKVNIYGEFLNVRYFTQRDNKQPPKRDFPMTKQKGVIVEPKDIDLSGDFHEQVDQILAAVRLTQEEATAVSSLYADLESVMQALWPGCVAMPFGSITTGLGIKTSDADCYLSVPAPYRPHAHTFVSRAKRLLQSHPHTFAEILTIPRANTPLVKFFHVPTETSCDLSFKTPLGAQNSRLIAFLLHADPRLLPAAVLLKYWAKVHGLSGTGRLSNYALTMMIIFYLQQPPSILPSVDWLQRDPKNDVLVDYWNTGFMDRKELLPACSNTSSISELLGGFFEFYASFNFEEMVVCPFLGRPVRKDAFLNFGQIPSEFELYKDNVVSHMTSQLRVNTAMCVQDPFEQCHNVASAISSKLASEINSYLKFAANSYETEKLKGCKGFLRTILLEKPKIVHRKTHPEFKIQLVQREVNRIVKPNWRALVRDATFTVFEKILKIHLGKMEEKVNPESKREKERYTGTLTKAVWRRKQFTRLYEMLDLDFTQKEIKITDEILNIEKAIFKIDFQLTLSFLHDPKNVIVLVKLLDGDSGPFMEFGRSLFPLMHSWIITLLKPHMIPSKENTAANIAETIKELDNNNDLDSDDDDDVTEGNNVEKRNEEFEMEVCDDEGDGENDISEVDNEVSQSTDEDVKVAVTSTNETVYDRGPTIVTTEQISCTTTDS